MFNSILYVMIVIKMFICELCKEVVLDMMTTIYLTNFAEYEHHIISSVIQ